MKRTPLVLLMVAVACGGSDPVSLKKLQPTLVIDITGGDKQVDTVGKELGTPIVARVTDSATGAKMAGQLVNWIVVSGGGSVFAPATLTNDTGTAQQRWTLGWAAGDQVLEARAIDPATGAALTFARVHATALPRPTLLLVNERTYKIVVTARWYSGETAVDSVSGASQHCMILPAVADSGWISWDGGGVPGQTGTLQWSSSLGWRLTFNANGWGWLSGEPTCVP